MTNRADLTKRIKATWAAKAAPRNALIKRGLLAGKTIQQIAISAGCGDDTVRTVCRKLSVEMNIPMPCAYEAKYGKRNATIKKCFEDGKVMKQIAFEAGCTTKTVSKVLKMSG
jgi:DNA-binding CsgD family transcriptional regulator